MATFRIMSGGAPKEIFLQLTPQFERQSGHKVDFVFAVMSALRDRLAAGEKADVLVMPTNILDGYQKDRTVRGAKVAPSSASSASMRWCVPVRRSRICRHRTRSSRQS